jgi:hypothetical protein
MARRASPRRPFTVALGFSILLHFSMFTLFSIVILFPREDIEYYELQFTDDPAALQPARAEDAPSPESRQALRIPSLEEALEEQPEAPELSAPLDPPELAAPEAPLLDDLLPEITLPTLEYAGFDRLRLREDSLRIRSQYEGVLRSQRRDSWSRFGSELSRLRDALTRLPVLERLALEERDEAGPQLISRPAEGFEAYIEWMSEPRDREVILAPPISALWAREPTDLDEPLVLVFRVNPEGKVVEVQLPLEDEAGVIAGTAAALMKYRFEPLDTEVERDQYGTFLISAKGEEAP